MLTMKERRIAIFSKNLVIEFTWVIKTPTQIMCHVLIIETHVSRNLQGQWSWAEGAQSLLHHFFFPEIYEKIMEFPVLHQVSYLCFESRHL